MRRDPSLLRQVAATFAVVALCVGGGGCSMFAGKNTNPVIGESQLNWLEVSYHPGMGQPVVQLSLLGSGNIRIKRGNSPLVGNDFSQDVANVKWNDVTVDQINVEPSEIHGVFQAFVNRGLLREPDKEFVQSATRGIPQARIIGTLGSEHVARLAVEPELVGFIRDLIKLFEEGKHASDARK